MSESPGFEWLRRAADELTGLLFQVSGYARRAKAVSRDDPELRRYLQSVEEGVIRASQLTRSIIDRMEKTGAPGPAGSMMLSPLEAGEVPEGDALRPADAPAAAAHLIEVLAELAAQNDIQIANLTGHRELILLVDDEAHVALLAKLMLCDEGYKVVTAYDGEEAVRVFKCIGSCISLVILDFIMPGMDGEAVFNELQKTDSDVAVVLSSGFAEQSKLNRMLARGLCGFIAKPYSQGRLLDQVRFILDATQSAKQNKSSSQQQLLPDAVSRFTHFQDG
ncbi:MAG: response regulator [Verrucomicrobia bacterium]|nr:response regulator [Verrucomicrobiota bacterium]